MPNGLPDDDPTLPDGKLTPWVGPPTEAMSAQPLPPPEPSPLGPPPRVPGTNLWLIALVALVVVLIASVIVLLVVNRSHTSSPAPTLVPATTATSSPTTVARSTTLPAAAPSTAVVATPPTLSATTSPPPTTPPSAATTTSPPPTTTRPRVPRQRRRRPLLGLRPSRRRKPPKQPARSYSGREGAGSFGKRATVPGLVQLAQPRVESVAPGNPSLHRRAPNAGTVVLPRRHGPPSGRYPSRGSGDSLLHHIT
jgi:hypothetical protein